MDQDRLTIRMTGKGEFISLASFLSVAESTLELLKDIDASISGSRRGSVEWRIADVSLNSPLTLTVFADTQNGTNAGREVIEVCTYGLRQVERSADVIPAYFSNEALEHAKKIVAPLNDDVERVALIGPSGDTVTPSQRLAANVDDLLPKEHDELGSVEGKLETLSIHGGTTFAIWEVLTGARVECRFPPEMLDEAHAAFRHRVSVSGRIRYSRTGRPLSIRVEHIRILRSSSELPQARDLEGIDITGGIDPAEYVRRLRSEA